MMTPVGSPIQAAALTFTLVPSHVGDFIVIEVIAEAGGSVPTAMSSTNVTWSSPIASALTPVSSYNAAVFIGTVTSTSSATVTVTLSSGSPTMRICGQEFSSTNGAAAVRLAGWAITSLGVSLIYPPLVPAGPGCLYFGYAADTSTASPGSAPGYTYFVDAHSNGMCYNASCSSAPQAPAWLDNSTRDGLAVILTDAPLPSVVTTTPGSSVLTPGPTSVSPGNKYGNLLVLMAAWTVQWRSNGVSTPLPVGAVADDADNFWRLASDSGNQASGVRCAAWVCPNAMPVKNWLSFCPQGFAASYWFIVAELSGLPASYWPYIDFYTNGNNAINTALNVPGVAMSPDYCFTIGMAGANGSVTATGPGAGWTALGNGSAVVSGNEDSTYAYAAWGAFAQGSSAAAAWTWSTNQVVTAGCTFGISQRSTLPPQNSPVRPRIVVEAALGATPGDPTTAILDTPGNASSVYSSVSAVPASGAGWYDMTQYAIGKQGEVAITAPRGQQYELAQPESGATTVGMNNQDGTFNPQNTGSRFYSNAINANMSFQNGIDPWIPLDNSQIAQSSDHPFSTGPAAVSRYSLKVTPDGVTSFPAALSEKIPINVNYQYTASAWIYFPAGYATGADVIIDWYDNSQRYISTSSPGLTPMAANTWTQSSLTATPPSNAAYAAIAVQAGGTPSSATVFYVAEAALVVGASKVQTGLIRLGTPMRISCFWNGRRYPISAGFIERWPQDWPDMPQWGWSKLIATDVVGAASAVNMPSAVQGEILAADPYVCFPFSEQYSTAAAGLNGVVKTASECDGQIATNTSPENQRTGTYIDGNQPVQTGLSVGLLGDSGTGMGVSGYSALDTTHKRGAGIQYGPDSGLPPVTLTAGGPTLEFWFNIPTVTIPNGDLMQLAQLLVRPNLYSNGVSNIAPGLLMSVGVQGQPSGNPKLYVQTSFQNFVSNGNAIVFGQPQHAAIWMVNGGLILSLNGQTPVPIVGSLPANTTLYALVFGGPTFSTGGPGLFGVNWNYSMAYGSVYGRYVSHNKTFQHYTAGTTGFSGDTVLQRAGRYIQWARLNLGLAGPSIADHLKLGPAYSVGGGSMASALNADAISSGSRWTSSANGNLIVLPRPAIYNQPPAIVFGDSPVGALNPNPTFQQASGWAGGNGASFSFSTSTLFYGNRTGQITPDGITANPLMYANNGSSIPGIVSGSSYRWKAWITSPAGWSPGAYAKIEWYNSSGTFLSSSTGNTAPLEPGVWSPVDIVATAPANATKVICYIQMVGTPPSSAVLNVALGYFLYELDEVPYEPSAGMDFDNSYLNNITQTSLTQGPNTLASPVYRGITSIGKYFARGPLAQSVSAQTVQDADDRGTWNLNKYEEPSMRVRKITVSAATRPLAFDSVLRSDLSSVASVIRRPLGGTPYTLPVITQKMTISIGPNAWMVDYQQSPYVPENSVLTADDPAYGTLNSSMGW